ncbi:unnamed protein product, partial [Cuscuta europaea]
MGQREPVSSRESFGSVSRTTDRPRLHKGKGKLHEEDARHHINAARNQAQGVIPTANSSGNPGFDALMNKLSALEREFVEERGDPIIQVRTKTPFTTRVLSAPIPEKYRGSTMKPYDGRTDPQEHFNRYQNNMLMVNASDEYLCRWFLSTLEGPTYEWFNALPEGSIDSWQDLAQRFLTHFAGRKRAKKHFSHLLSVKQQPNETLRSFIDRWMKETNEVEGADKRTLLVLFQGGLRISPYALSLITDPPRSYLKAIQRGSLYADADDLHSFKKDGGQPLKKTNNTPALNAPSVRARDQGSHTQHV